MRAHPALTLDQRLCQAGRRLLTLIEASGAALQADPADGPPMAPEDVGAAIRSAARAAAALLAPLRHAPVRVLDWTCYPRNAGR